MLRSRTSRFFGQPSPDKTFADVAREIGAVIKRDRQRSSDVILASYSIGCDGRPTVSLLDGSPCDPEGGTIGLATRDRALLSGVLPRPYQSNAAESGALVSAVREIGAASGAGRYFIDSLGQVYDGRLGLYHSGYDPLGGPNGTRLDGDTDSVPFESDSEGDIRSDWDWPYAGDYDSYRPEQFSGSAWSYVTIDGFRVPGAPADACYTPAFHFPGGITGTLAAPFYSLEPWGQYDVGPLPVSAFDVSSAGYVVEQPLQSYQRVGRSDETAGYIVGVEGYFFSGAGGAYPTGLNGPYTGTLRARLVVRDAITFAVLAYRDLTDVEAFAISANASRCATAAYPMGWRAGIQVRPASDGLFVVSILDSTRAWVFEVADDGTGVGIALLETVNFPDTYSGVIRVLYR